MTNQVVRRAYRENKTQSGSPGSTQVGGKQMQGSPIAAPWMGVNSATCCVRDEVPMQSFSSRPRTASSPVAAEVGLVLLANSLVALRTASQQCDSGRDYLASCLIRGTMIRYTKSRTVSWPVGLTVSSFGLHFLSCEISVSLLYISDFSAVSSPVGLNVWKQTGKTENYGWKRL